MSAAGGCISTSSGAWNYDVDGKAVELIKEEPGMPRNQYGWLPSLAMQASLEVML